MENIKSRIIHAFEIVAALMMAAMFASFILQVTIRYTARAEWIKDIFPFLHQILKIGKVACRLKKLIAALPRQILEIVFLLKSQRCFHVLLN